MAFDWRSLLAPRLLAIAAISFGDSLILLRHLAKRLPRHLHIVDLSCSGPSFERPALDMGMPWHLRELWLCSDSNVNVSQSAVFIAFSTSW